MEIFEGSTESQNYFEKAVTEKDIELEIIFGSKVSKNPITRKVFLRLIDRCKQVYESLPVTTDLDIRYDFRGNPSNVRCTIHGMDFIKEYCNKRIFPGWNMKDDPARTWFWNKEEIQSGIFSTVDRNSIIEVFEKISYEIKDP